MAALCCRRQGQRVATGPLLAAAAVLLIGVSAYTGLLPGAATFRRPSPVSADTLALAAAADGTPLSPTCVTAMLRLNRSAPAAVWPPPCPAPPALVAAYEGPAGSMPMVRDWCFAQRYEGENVLYWSAAYVESYCAAVAAGAQKGSYSLREVDQVRNMFAGAARAAGGKGEGLAGTTGLVLGTEQPWVECLALSAGATSVWTSEYSTIISTHPRLHAAPTKAMALAFARGALEPVDWVVSFSSLEHSGLGRYGDALNPDGDRDAMEEALCTLRPGGFMALGVPMSCAHDGRIEFNAHRIYGFARLAYITAGFELLGFHGAGGCKPYLEATQEGSPQSIILLRRPADGVTPPALTADDFARAAGGMAAV